MLTTLIRQELLNNMMTFRFTAAVLIILLLIVTNTYVLIKDYEQRLVNYNASVKTHQQELWTAQTYSAGTLSVARPPNPLSIFNVGLDKRLGNEIEISYTFVPTLWDATMSGAHNPFLNLFTSIDIVFIFQVILSLIALMFSYDAIAGAHENGTLRLVLIHPVRRGHILLAKYISAILCLLMPILFSILLALILFTFSPALSLSIPDFLRIGWFTFVSIAYLSVFYLIGMLISTITRQSKTSLMLSMLVWGFLVLIYPNMSLALINPPTTQAHTASTFNQIKQMWEEFDRERKHFLATDKIPGDDPSLQMMGYGGYSVYFYGDLSRLLYYYESKMSLDTLDDESQLLAPYAENYFNFLVQRTISTAERTWHVRKPTLDSIFIQSVNRERMVLNLSPVGIYDEATQALVGTDLLSIQDFFNAARQYRQTVINFFYDKKLFGARQWFSAGKGAADWHLLPEFSFQRSPVEDNVKRALPYLFLLLVINLILIIGVFLIFRKKEV